MDDNEDRSTEVSRKLGNEVQQSLDTSRRRTDNDGRHLPFVIHEEPLTRGERVSTHVRRGLASQHAASLRIIDADVPQGSGQR